ncbi:MAG: hypothetical protein HWN68_04665 [Desulfobacterales bacterium]|nr:hypothetical protein [Desulfobacterales bacterium]
MKYAPPQLNMLCILPQYDSAYLPQYHLPELQGRRGKHFMGQAMKDMGKIPHAIEKEMLRIS